MLRTCRHCGDTYPLNKTYFGHNPQGGFRWKCRACVRRYVSSYNRGNARAIERTELRRSTAFTAAEKAQYGRQLADRDGGWLCFYCKTKLTSAFHIDHKLPIARGGLHHLENFVLACMPCNQEKHAKTIDEYREWRRDRGLSVKF